MQSTNHQYRRSNARSFLIGLLLLSVGVIAMAWLGPMMQWDTSRPESATWWLVGLYAATGAVSLWLAWIARRVATPFVWIAMVMGVGLRMMLIAQPVQYETDHWRYLWDGAVLAHGIDPYRYSPEQITRGEVDQSHVSTLNRLRDEFAHGFAQINHPHIRTIYPPPVQLVFAAGHWVMPFDDLSLRVLFLFAELGVIAVVWRLLRDGGSAAAGQLNPIAPAMLWLLSPIVLKEYYISAHMDGLVVLPTVLACLLASTRRPTLAGAALGLAIGFKLWPVLLLPVLIRYSRSWRLPVSTIVVAGICLAPMFISQVDDTSGVVAYSDRWAWNAGAFTVIHHAIKWVTLASGVWLYQDQQIARYIVGAIILAVATLACIKPIADGHALMRRCAVVVGAMFLLSPTQFPWYFTWVMPFLVFFPFSAMWLYVITLPLYHKFYALPWLAWVEHLPIWLGLAVQGLRRWSKR